MLREQILEEIDRVVLIMSETDANIRQPGAMHFRERRLEELIDALVTDIRTRARSKHPAVKSHPEPKNGKDMLFSNFI